MPWCKALIAGAFSLLTLIAVVGSSQRAHGTTVTYNMNLTIGDLTVGIGTAVGSIETNGTLGPLSAADIVSWNLTLTDGAAGSFDLSPNPGQVLAVGAGLSATPDSLLFDFSGPGNVFYIATGTTGPGSAGLCFQGSSLTCSIYFYPPPGASLEVGLGVVGNPLPYTAISGTNVIAVASVVPPPIAEPAPFALFALGTGALAVLRRRTRSRNS